MARIRTIKPEYFQDEKLAPLDVVTRFVFLGLISMADDAGRLLDNVKVIDAFIFPESGESSRDSLATLSRIGRIVRGTTQSGQRVIQITNWTRHQRVDKPNFANSLPELVELQGVTEFATDSRAILESVANGSRPDLRSTTTDLRPPTTDQTARADARESEWLAEFAQAWREYPRRPGDSAAKARKAYLARRKAGVSAEELLAGVRAYAAYLQREQTAPRFIKQGATFFGAEGEHWRASYDAPPTLSPGQRVMQIAERQAAERRVS